MTAEAEAAEEVAAVESADHDAVGAADVMTTLRVVRGEPTDEELAALVAVITMRGVGGGEGSKSVNASGWTNRSRYIRAGLWHIADGWRTSAYPQ